MMWKKVNNQTIFNFFRYIGRPPSAASACGNKVLHKNEVSNLLGDASDPEKTMSEYCQSKT